MEENKSVLPETQQDTPKSSNSNGNDQENKKPGIFILLIGLFLLIRGIMRLNEGDTEIFGIIMTVGGAFNIVYYLAKQF